MTQFRFLAIVSVLFALTVASLSPADAQSTPRRAKPKPPAPAVVVAAAPVPEGKCLRALNGACTDPTAVEIARLRAFIIPAVRVSYFGTPAGTIGGAYIPFERFFQDDPVLFGLPTFSLVVPGCCIRRSK